MKNIRVFYLKIFSFSEVKFSIYLNRRVFVMDCGYSLEPPQQDSSNEYPQSMFLAEIRKIICTPVNPSFT